MIGLAETGSGKTEAPSACPSCINCWKNHPRLFGARGASALRGIAVQIHEVFDALGKAIGLRCVCIVGGVEVARLSSPALANRTA